MVHPRKLCLRGARMGDFLLGWGNRKNKAPHRRYARARNNKKLTERRLWCYISWEKRYQMIYQEHFQQPKKKFMDKGDWSLALVALAYVLKPTEMATDGDMNRWAVAGGLFLLGAALKTVSVVQQIKKNKKQSVEQMVQQEKQQRIRTIKRLCDAVRC